jgi:REP element-mobilizing transposase RayT
MPDYRRWRVRGGTYFLTINLLERRSDLLVRQIDALREAVRRPRRDRPLHINLSRKRQQCCRSKDTALRSDRPPMMPVPSKSPAAW